MHEAQELDLVRFSWRLYAIFLVPRVSGQDFTILEGFTNFMAKTYNQKKRAALPKMHVNIDGSYSGHNQAIEWTLTNDPPL